MGSDEPLAESERVLVLAPAGRDAALCGALLASGGLEACICPDIAALCAAVSEGAAAAIVVEEALPESALRQLEACLARQPKWSDFPTIVLMAATHVRRRPLSTFQRLGNVRVLDRPLEGDVLLSAVQAAVRGRRRQYEALAERLQHEAELERAEEFQRRLIGIAGHDLRSPLAAILMASSMLARADLGERDLRQVQRISRAGKRMERLISDLTDYTRWRVGSPMSLSVRAVSFHDVCESALAELRTAAPEAVIRYEPDGDPTGEWDGDRLEQVLGNLLTNAVKYGSPGEPITLRWTRTGSDESGDRLICEVANRGAPIPAELLPSIFEPFRMGGQTERSGTHSMGLGLFIVREIVRAHGGTVRVTSTAEAGTRFTFELPRAAPKRTDEVREGAEGPG